MIPTAATAEEPTPSAGVPSGTAAPHGPAPGMICHAASPEFGPLLDGLGVRAEFLSGSLTSARKREIHDAIGGGMAEVVIGTHAVISEAVAFPRLGLAIVDEQHRFGVGQRAALQAKGSGREPHLLALTVRAPHHRRLHLGV